MNGMSQKSTNKAKFPFGEIVTLSLRGDKVISHSRPMTRQEYAQQFRSKPLPGETRMKCPCGDYYSDDPMLIARHMRGKFDKLHISWMEANGLDPLDLLAQGGLKRLALFLEKCANR